MVAVLTHALHALLAQGRRPWIAAILVAALVVGAQPATPAAHAAGSTVGCGPDRTARLVEAVVAANSGGPSTVTLTPGCTYELFEWQFWEEASYFSALPEITGNVTIAGNGAVITRGDRPVVGERTSVRLATVQPGATLVLQDLTVSKYQNFKDGGALYVRGALTLVNTTLTENASRGTEGSIVGRDGGAIYVNGGTATLINSTLSRNQVGADRSGGGMYVNSGTVSLTNSTVSENQVIPFPDISYEPVHPRVGNGGGIALRDGTLTLTNSTVTANTACFYGGGLSVGGTVTLVNTTISGNSVNARCTTRSVFGGGLRVVGNASLINSTVSGNTAGTFQDVGGIGGGVSVAGTLTLLNTIIAANSTGFGDPPSNNCSLEFSLPPATISDGGNNIQDSGQKCGRTIRSANVRLAGDGGKTSGLDLNGGPTRTVALQPGSPAINAGNPATCTGASVGNHDQRGFTHVGACDIGAYESGAAPVARTLSVSRWGTGSGTVTSVPAGIGCGATCQASVADGATVTLTAVPAPGSVFTGWAGACTGTGACTFRMWGDQAVWATFTAPVLSPTVTAAFVPSSMAINETSTLTLTLTNPTTNPGGLTGIGITAPFPAGLQVATPPGAATTCGGTFAPTAGRSSIDLTGGAIAVPGATCAISVQVTGTSAGVKVTTTAAATSTEGSAGGTASATLTVVGPPRPPALAMVFSPNSIAKGATAQLGFTITNPNPTLTLTGIGFTTTLPAGLTVTAATTSNVCGNGSSLTVNAGARTVQLTGGSVGTAPNTCTFAVPVTGTTEGSSSATTPSITSVEGGTNSTVPAATLKVFAPPAVAKAFNPATITNGSVTTLTITITNPATNPGGLSGIGIVDPFPAGLTVGGTPAPTNTCGGTFTPAAGAGSITLTGGSITTAGGSCSISVKVLVNFSGARTNTTNAVTSTEGGAGGTASATLGTIQPPTIAQSFTPATITIGATSVLKLTITNPNTGSQSLTSVSVTDTLPVGVEVHAAPNVSTTCGGTATAAAAGRTLALTGGTLVAGASCSVSVTVRGTLTGDLTNATQPITAAESGAGAASAPATLTVEEPDGAGFVSGDTGGGIIPVGRPFSFTFVVANHDATPATAANLAVTLPTGIQVTSIVFRRGGIAVTSDPTNGPSCTWPAPGKVTCTLGALAQHDALTVQINATRYSAPAYTALCAQGMATMTVGGQGLTSVGASCAR